MWRNVGRGVRISAGSLPGQEAHTDTDQAIFWCRPIGWEGNRRPGESNGSLPPPGGWLSHLAAG